jgi:hypothetical protein
VVSASPPRLAMSSIGSKGRGDWDSRVVPTASPQARSSRVPRGCVRRRHLVSIVVGSLPRCPALMGARRKGYDTSGDDSAVAVAHSCGDYVADRGPRGRFVHRGWPLRTGIVGVNRPISRCAERSTLAAWVRTFLL